MAAVDGGIVRPSEWRRVREFIVADRVAPAALVVLGEAGAGKSTLWRGGVEAAEMSGHQVLRSEPSASETDLSFAGLSDLLAKVLPAVAAVIPAPQFAALEVALLLRSAGDQPPTAAAVGLGFLSCLRACAASGPVLVAIDDVQWLDDASLDALTFGLRRVKEGPVSVLLAARTQHAADPLTVGARPLADRWRSLLAALPPAQTIELAPLSISQVQNLLPASVSPAQARLIARQSRGNPFWAKEILASLESGDGTVPPLALTLNERLSRSLSAEAAQALAAVAAAGRIDLSDTLAALADLPRPAAAIDAAVLAGVLVEGGNRVSVAHPLIGAAALESLPPGRRATIYRRLAEGASDPERYAHFAALAAQPGPDAAVADALDAAAEAAHSRAGNVSAAHFAQAAVTFTPDGDMAALVRRRIRASELLFLAGEVESSLEQLQCGDVHALSTPDLERALPMLLDLADIVRGSAEASAIVARAVEVVGDDPRRRALVLALSSDYVYGIAGQRRAAAMEAIRCAKQAGSVADYALHRAIINLVVAKVFAAEGLDTGLLKWAAQVEARLPTVRLYDSAELCGALWSGFLEDLDTARIGLQRCIERARECDDDYPLCVFLAYLAVVEEMGGDYAAAASALETARAAAESYDWRPSAWHFKPQCELLISQGHLDGAVAVADESMADEDSAPVAARYMGACIRGQVSAWRGDAHATIRHLERAGWLADQREWADPGVRDRLDTLLAEAYVVVGRLDDARRISLWLRGIGERLHRNVVVGDADRIDALLAAQLGDLDTAANCARAAVAAHRSTALRPALARSLLVLGRIERRRKARGQSRAALQDARQLAIDMGHRPLLAEIERELPRTEAARSGTELTVSEQRVADLVGTGATNRDVAAALFVSVRTVETHVASIYRKLGVRTRAELARHLSGTSSKLQLPAP